ncbi:MAG: hypothetical protein U1E15_12015 [Hyphomicrobiales bacterium]
MQNTGNTVINKLSAIDDLTAPDRFGSAFTPSPLSNPIVGVAMAPTIYLGNNSGLAQAPTPNSNYDGTSDLLWI